MKLEEINNITIIGAGTMGVGIAQDFAQGGFVVQLIDQEAEALDRSKMQIQTNLELFLKHDLLIESIPSI